MSRFSLAFIGRFDQLFFYRSFRLKCSIPFCVFSLRNKRSRTKRTKFGQRVLVFRIHDAQKMGREQKG